ncbi:hypothetical protein A7K93_07440 [Candidatus Methylacidiphilum fumarolicum]|uniref:hypothetical protein n=1 Tax=Candidatus Methylacidiphilum fumarolicum TaxID=591154 RepID=UPI0005D30E8C|nr:hypothetical protein [Candidatus Methylacidiphilum fumarolicum]MBW6414351.1 hypothetical protein [Candidatus Methylacidiphilum fumarolicum]TFE67863.1 hypothetical protein A7K73_08530 [Candidatus Methylacidiphilum fumarolicum]TFE73010.1 hypothetical protein A7K93_07440 [Candidatus Methylacidiphilum fumarolicum]TFE75102.1 hypothetical protein A7K72_02625 [Candidatus Methylacidiphilum fumarolicum]TFE76324.1 hypothetical protein A7D33_10320 [Candidatus Methylacidiphilum fumarolicum]
MKIDFIQPLPYKQKGFWQRLDSLDQSDLLLCKKGRSTLQTNTYLKEADGLFFNQSKPLGKRGYNP